MDDPITALRPSQMRYGFGLACITGFCLISAFALFAWNEGGWGVRGFFALAALVSGWAAYQLWRGGRRAVLLTEAGLVEDTGDVIAPFDAIKKVDRSPFATKPSNGFIVHLTEPAERGWRFGLWWRLGKRVGIGGLTSGADGRLMADLLTMRLRERDGEPSPLTGLLPDNFLRRD